MDTGDAFLGSQRVCIMDHYTSFHYYSACSPQVFSAITNGMIQAGLENADFSSAKRVAIR